MFCLKRKVLQKQLGQQESEQLSREQCNVLFQDKSTQWIIGKKTRYLPVPREDSVCVYVCLFAGCSTSLIALLIKDSHHGNHPAQSEHSRVLCAWLVFTKSCSAHENQPWSDIIATFLGFKSHNFSENQKKKTGCSMIWPRNTKKLFIWQKSVNTSSTSTITPVTQLWYRWHTYNMPVTHLTPA